MTKIAFLFLLVGNPIKSNEWKKFFQNANPSRFSIYAHCSNHKHITDPFFKSHLIKNKIPTKWGDISLVKAMFLLLKEAFKDKNNTHFQFISDSCVPLFPFHFIFNELTRLNKSFIEYIPDQKRNINPLNNILKKNLPNYRQSQWMTLIRSHVEFFLSNEKIEYFAGVEIPDESYFINMLMAYKPEEEENIVGQSLTYVNWKCELPRPKVFNELGDEYLVNSLSGGYLFLRKVSLDCKTEFMLPKVDLLEYLKQYKNEKCVLAPIGGWAGDAFITLSTLEVFKNLELNYKIYMGDNDVFYKNAVLFVCGSGNLVNYYNSVSLSLLRWDGMNIFRKIVILPSTINSHYDVLNSMCSEVEILCRERVSYHLLKNNVENKKILLTDDISFYFDIEKWKNKTPYLNHLVSIRNDSEKTDIPSELLPPFTNNNDIAENYLGKCKNYQEITKACFHFLDTISKYKVIYTNRLHIAIAATRMKRKVIFFNNSYFKNIAVYQNSLYLYDNIFMCYPYKLLNYKPYISIKEKNTNKNIFTKNNIQNNQILLL